jgi:hypothetical protein
LDQGSVALFVDVEPVVAAGRFSIDEHAQRHGRTSLPLSHGEMDVAGVEAERDRPSAWFSTLARLPIVQSPDRAHWLSLNESGAT